MEHWHRLIRDSLAAAQNSADDHPPAETLAACLRRQLPRRHRRRVLEHVQSCPDCRATLLAAAAVTEPARHSAPLLAAAAAAVLVVGIAFAAHGIWTPIAVPAPPAPAVVARAPAAAPGSASRAARASLRSTPPSLHRELAATKAALAPSRRRRTTAPLSAGLAAPAPSVAVPGSDVASASSGFLEQPRLQPTLTTTPSMAANLPVAVAAAPANSAPAPTLFNLGNLGTPRAVRASLASQGVRRFTIRLPLGTAPALTGTAAPALAANSWAPPAATPLAWRLAAGGTLLASADGKVWSAWPATPAAQVEAVAAAGPRVWIAGPGAALYFSADGGAHWTPLAQLPNVVGPAAAIRSIEFDDALHGSLLTAAGRSWTTDDGGHTWQPASTRGNLQKP